jgi:Protein of unknown function (DUF4230)
MKSKKPFIYLIVGVVFVAVIWKGVPAFVNSIFPASKTVVTHEAIVEKIQQMGHMQVVKLNIKDIVEYKVERDIWPDSKVLLMVAGEVGAGINLSNLKESDIVKDGDKTIIYVPSPEINYSKIDHEHTKIHDKTSWWLLDNDAELIDNSFKQAEAYLKSDAVNEQALTAAIEATPGMLEPIFTKLVGEPVQVKFRNQSLLGSLNNGID